MLSGLFKGERLKVVISVALTLSLTACGGGSGGSGGNETASGSSTDVSGLGLVFATKESGEYTAEALYVYDVSSGNTQRLDNPTVSSGRISSYLPSPNKKLVAYTADHDTLGVFELYVAAADGSLFAKVNPDFTPGQSVSRYFWSADSNELLYVADQETEDVSELFRATSDGTSIEKISGVLVNGGDVSIIVGPRASSVIAFIADKNIDDVFELFLVFPDRSIRRVNGLMQPAGDIKSFRFSPNGRYIAYRADQELDEVIELYVHDIQLDQTVKINRALVNDEDVESAFRWSPDSSRIAFQIDGPFQSDPIFLASPDGVLDIEIGSCDLCDYDSFGWNAASTRIIFPDRDRNGTAIVDRDGLLVNLLQAGYVNWSPGSQEFLFIDATYVNCGTGCNNYKYEGFVANQNGSEIKKINAPLGDRQDVVTNPIWYQMAWSPDSSRVAYIADQNVSGFYELFVFTVSNSGNTQVNDGAKEVEYFDKVIWPKWSHNGSALAYVEIDSFGDTVINIGSWNGDKRFVIPRPAGAGAHLFGFAWVEP